MQAPRLTTGHKRASTDECSRIVVVDGSNDDKITDNYDNNYDNDDDDNVRRRSHAFSLCAKNERERLLYTSSGHDVTVYTVTSSSPLTNHNRPPHHRARFLLMYKGIPDIMLFFFYYYYSVFRFLRVRRFSSIDHLLT